jgi:hypothetical protein
MAKFLTLNGVSYLTRKLLDRFKNDSRHGIYNLYVNNNGEDNPLAGWSANNPFKTIKYCVVYAHNNLTGRIRINLADGNYPEAINLRTPNGSYLNGLGNQYFFCGNSNPQNVIVGGGEYSPETHDVHQLRFENSTLDIYGMTFKLPVDIPTNYIMAFNATHSNVMYRNTIWDISDLESNKGFDYCMYVGTNARVFVTDSKFIGSSQPIYGMILANHIGLININGKTNTIQGPFVLESSSAALIRARGGSKVNIYNESIVLNGTLSGGKKYHVDQCSTLGEIANLPTSSLSAGTVATNGQVY